MKKLLGLLLTVATLTTTTSNIANAKSNSTVVFSDIQKQNLQIACDFGKQLEVENVDMCYVMSAIAWQESSAGLKIHSKYDHGMYQINIKTLRSRSKLRGLDMTDSQLINLMKNHGISASYAYEEFDYWFGQRKGNLHRTLASYNAGWKYENGKSYADSVIKKMNYLKKHKVVK